MSYSVRYQVFVSSTFTDLVDERAEIIQAIWELDCIPTGMEAFVASNESQWSVITRVIDECDYYVLVIGGRYGSVTGDGISYTEREYRYAKSSGIPVLAFVHSNPEQIPSGKVEKDAASQEKLDAFRAEVMKDHPVRKWSSPAELGGLVSRSLVREIKISPRPGWIRNDGSSPVALLEQINKLTEENRQLRAKIPEDGNIDIDPSLEGGDDRITLIGVRQITRNGSLVSEDEEWSVTTDWNEIFRDLGPSLINETTETYLRRLLSRFHSLKPIKSGYDVRRPATVSLESWHEVLIQLRALGLITQGVKKRAVTDKESYWRITDRGDRYLVSLLARRKPVA